MATTKLLSEAVTPALHFIEGAAAATPGTGEHVLYYKSADGGLYTKDDAGVETAVVGGAIDAAGVTFDPTGLGIVTGDDVQEAIEELDAAVDAISGVGTWDQAISKGSDQGVTNSATLVDDSALVLAVGAGEVWRFELDIVYTTDATGDYKCDLAVSAGSMSGWWRYIGSDTTANAILLSTGIRESSATSLTDIAAGGGSTAVLRFIHIEGVMSMSSAGNLTFRFAQNTQTVGQTATTKAGSVLRAKRLI